MSTKKCNKDFKVAVANAQELHVLQSVYEASKLNIANFILVGNEVEIRGIIFEEKLDIENLEIINEYDEVLAVKKAIELVRDGKADALMKGLVETSTLMKEVLKKENNFRTERKLSHLAIFELPTYHKLLFVTDAALNIAPDIDTKKDIIQNGISALENLGILKPKVALLCAKEKVDKNMPVTIESDILKKMWENNEIEGGIVDGPLALDNAISYESVKIKGIVSEVAGDADLLVCPNIEAGNILYKSLSFLGNSKNGGVILGAKKPIILTSRADSVESKVISIALGIMCAGGKSNE